ncbi:(4Fe-4S)-binding protein [Serratia marcescens]|uniref:(4Fe-4S)-binding protein n=1 Tax=Serratia marcescens TaxID=615 RepID=UPI003FA725FF
MDEKLTAAGYRHSANCVRGNAAIFTLNRRPWIMPDNAEPAGVKRVIDSCPSGALKYREK